MAEKKYRDTKEHRKLTKKVEASKRSTAKTLFKEHELKADKKAVKKMGGSPKRSALLVAEKKHGGRKVYN